MSGTSNGAMALFPSAMEPIAMTYRFQSKAAGDVLMLGPAGDSVMRAMGLVPVDKGILQPQAMPAAIHAAGEAIVWGV